jgi:hypothetical protein
MATLAPGEHARMYALGKIMRGGASRGGYVPGSVFITIDGVHFGFGRDPGRPGVLLESLTITDELDATPNTCTFTINGAVAIAGSEVIVTLGSKNSGTRLFAGYALTVDQVYAADTPANLQSIVHAVDYTWQFGFVKVTRQYRQWSATGIAINLIDSYAAANGFTFLGIPTGVILPVLDEITFTNEDLDTAFTRLARRIGGYWYVDYSRRVHLFFDESSELPPPEALTPTHASLADFRKTADRTQVLTRVYVEGRGTSVLAPAAAGASLVAVESVQMFEVAADVFAKVSPQGSSGGSQHLTYTGADPGNKGALVGPGIGPTEAPTLTLADGAGVTPGTHSYAYTFATGSGETFPSPIGTIITGQPLPNPTVPPAQPTNNPTGTPAMGSFIPIGDTLCFAYAYATTAHDAGLPFAQWKTTLVSPQSAQIVTVSNNDPLNPAMSAPVYVTTPRSADTRAKSVAVWLWSKARHEATGNGWGLWRRTAILPAADNVHHTGSGGYGDFAIQLPAANTTGTQNRVTVGVPIYTPDPTLRETAAPRQTVTSRKIYRTAANAGQLKLLTTLADNVTTSYLDSTADASLGVNAPIADTSGLQADGQVPAGSTELIVSGTGAFRPTGGIAIVGNGRLFLTYTGISSSQLIGIPATGPGSITVTLAYNTTVTAPAMLTGVSGITAPLVNGDELYLVVQCDDPARQAQVADMVNLGPGIREEWVQDRRLSATEARARGHATLAQRPLEEVTVTYRCRDTRTAAGKTITVNLGPPTNVTGTHKIQHVTISNFRPHPTQYPTYIVTASTRRFSFEDWLRRMETSS